MDQTAGKIRARKYFYENYLPSFMTPRSLRHSNVLTLLGEDFRELELLDDLDIPRYQVFSVERDLEIYNRQRLRNRREDLGVALYYGDLSEYIHSYIFTDHRISVFNLDICGSFLNSVDPVLGQLLLFARRNPLPLVCTNADESKRTKSETT